jgi:hypothetical protein
MKRRDRKKADEDMLAAKSISVLTCKHNCVYVRLHDAQGRIFAVAGMDATTANRFAANLMTEIIIAENGTGADCGSVH